MISRRLIVALPLICAACAVAPTTPREYLDEQTAATITVVADPWIFAKERSNDAIDHRDFLNVYAIDVNRMGDHKQYFAVLQSAPPPSPEGASTPAPTLRLKGAGDAVLLEASTREPRELGLATPVAASYTLNAKWWYYPVDARTLAALAHSNALQAALIVDDAHTPYVLWRDGRAAMEALSSAAPAP